MTTRHETAAPHPSRIPATQPWILLLLACSWIFSARADDAAVANPVLAGDFPDPSVIRVGQEYWATATTSEWAPLFPLLHSRDLRHWERAGAVFQQRPAWSVGNYWAPEISEYHGRFYVYYVGRQRNGPLSVAVATAPQPDGPYTDHGPLVSQPAGSIDPFATVDENGQRYLIWKEDGNSRKLPTPLWAQKLSEDGTRLVGEMREILRNDAPWENNLIEGPCIVRRNGWFYLFYSGNACCGRGCNYALGVARAKKLLGPWEKNPANPILIGNEDWKCPGHGTVVTDPQGQDFFLYHAYDARTFVYVGRQGLLDKVSWNPNGWPSLRAGPAPNRHQPDAAFPSPGQGEFFDDFTAATLNPNWQWPQSNEPIVRLDAKAQGRLILTPTPDHARHPLGGILAVQTISGDYTATAQLDLATLKPGVVAGLSAYGDQENALGLAAGDGKLTLWNRRRNQHQILTTQPSPSGDSIYLRMTALDGHRFRFASSRDGQAWQRVGDDIDLEGNHLPPWDRGVRIALTVGGTEQASAAFEGFRVSPGLHPTPAIRP